MITKWKTPVSNKSVSVRPGLLTCRSSYRPSRGSLPSCARESRRERSKGNDSGFKNYYLPTRRQEFWWSQAVFLGGWRGVSILTSQKSFPASWWIIILKTTIITFTPIPSAFSCTTWQASSGRTIAAPTSQQSWSHSHRLVWSKCLDKVVPK